MDHSEADIAELLSSVPKGKSTKDWEIIARYLFENPRNIGEKLSKISSTGKESGQCLDSYVLFKLFKNIGNLNLIEAVCRSLTVSLQSLQNKERLSGFITNSQNIKFFYVLMFWDQFYKSPLNNLNLLKYLNLIKHLDAPSKNKLLQWSVEIPAEFLQLQVRQLHKLLVEQLQKMKPGMVAAHLYHIVQLNVLNTLEFLKFLYSSNTIKNRIPVQFFTKHNLTEYIKPLDLFKVLYRKQKKINIIEYPFIFKVDYKYNFLQIESILEQKKNMQKNMDGGLMNLLNGNVQMDANGGFSLQNLIYLHFEINRNNLLNDSMEKLGKVKQSLKNPLRIKFLGEQGADQGGVQNQYFQLLTKEIFNPYLDMFVSKNHNRIYWFNGFSYEPPIRFQFVGMLLGLAIYNSVHLNIKFPKFLYKKLLIKGDHQPDVNELLEELHEIQPQYYSSMRQILDSKDSLEPLSLFFDIQLQNFGQKIIQELVEEGSLIPLTQDNKEEYVYMYCENLLNKQVQKQFKAFKLGFDRVVDTEYIQMFSDEELELIICGSQVIDFHEMQAYSHYQGYTKDTPIIRELWKQLHGLTQEQKKSFLMFCTGSDRVPIGGLKSLNFLVQRNANTNNFPTAHTCFNVLLLPEYQNPQKLRKNLEFILQNNQGFGLI